MYINESDIGMILDIIDAAKDAGNTVSGKYDNDPNKKVSITNNLKKFRGSISAQAKKLVMTFPVITSNTMDPKIASMVSKAIERKCVALLQMIFAANMICDNGIDSADEFINQFFTNLDLNKINVDDVLNIMDRVGIKESYEFRKTVQELCESLKAPARYYEESLSETTLQDFRLKKFGYSDERIISEASGNNNNNGFEFIGKQPTGNRRLLDSDVKKANELVPSLLVVDYKVMKGGTPVPAQSIVGIKTRMVPVDSMEIINKIYTKNKDKNNLTNFIRATTGEIHFVRDFLLAINRAKIDAISRSRRGSVNPIWKALERRALKQKGNKTFGKANDAAAITTLVITQAEVDYLKKYYNISIDNKAVAKEILDAYNLLALVIVDETIEVAKFLFDAEEWETLSFNSLEKEGDNGMYKKVINLMAKNR